VIDDCIKNSQRFSFTNSKQSLPTTNARLQMNYRRQNLRDIISIEFNETDTTPATQNITTLPGQS